MTFPAFGKAVEPPPVESVSWWVGLPPDEFYAMAKTRNFSQRHVHQPPWNVRDDFVKDARVHHPERDAYFNVQQRINANISAGVELSRPSLADEARERDLVPAWFTAADVAALERRQAEAGDIEIDETAVTVQPVYIPRDPIPKSPRPDDGGSRFSEHRAVDTRKRADIAASLDLDDVDGWKDF